jgi:hypothetical protein
MTGRPEDVVADIEFDDDDDDELFLEDDDDYLGDEEDYWVPRPAWMHPECVDPSAAMEHGTCCKYPAETLVRRVLDHAEAVDHVLIAFDDGDADCVAAASELARLFAAVPGLVAEIGLAVRGGNRTVAAQLLCPIGRMIMFGLELAGRPRCPSACGDRGAPDLRPVLATIVPLLEKCDEALWSVVLPRPRRRRGA